MAFQEPDTSKTAKHSGEADRGYSERNLCVEHGGHEECPYKEVGASGVLTFCSCSCHLDPESLP